MPDKTRDRIALVFGATGLVGNCLVEELKDNASYSSIEVFTRTPIDSRHEKINQHLIDFNRLEEYASLFKGDDLFICLGTTIRKAGSVRKVEEIDRDLPARIAQIASENGVSRIAVVSSLGANPSSRNYYLRIKGEMEAAIRKIQFEQIVIARPSMLTGRRKEFRFGEVIGKIFMTVTGFLLLGPARKYRSISGQTVAAAMIALIQSPHREIVYQSDELQKFGKR
jgi:uncharacterized protein YbjT (DUF2867 family)